MRIQRMLLLLIAVFTQHLKAQQPGPLDTAPAPSPRFPAAWYPATDAFATTAAPITGKPYVATMETTGRYLNQSTGVVTVHETKTMQERDHDGRRREETATERPGPDGNAVEVRTVTVRDVVSHCTFSWMEPWVVQPQYDHGPVATVTCAARVAHLQDDNVFAKTATAPESETHQFNTTRKLQHLSPADVEGLKVLVTRTTSITTPQNGAPRQLIIDWWYAPNLEELIRVQYVPTDEGHPSPGTGPDIRLTTIQRIEPDAALFYPPAGYRIESSLQKR